MGSPSQYAVWATLVSMGYPSQYELPKSVWAPLVSTGSPGQYGLP